MRGPQPAAGLPKVAGDGLDMRKPYFVGVSRWAIATPEALPAWTWTEPANPPLKKTGLNAAHRALGAHTIGEYRHLMQRVDPKLLDALFEPVANAPVFGLELPDLSRIFILGASIGGPEAIAGDGDTIIWWYVRTDSGIEGWVPANTAEAALLQPLK